MHAQIITISLLILLAAYLGTAMLNSDSYAGQELELELNKRLSDAAKKLGLEFKLSKLWNLITVFKIPNPNSSGLYGGQCCLLLGVPVDIYSLLVCLLDRAMCQIFQADF